jgi:DNA-binding transcriptional ArsR family regulator
VNLPSDSAGGSEQAAAISNIDVLKALADPLRLNLLYALTNQAGPELPIRSVKELAAELGEPQTKLYRHIKHLESAGLIRAVASRVVSGILEQRYQATQAEFMVGDGFSDQEKASPESEAMAAAAMEFFRRQFFAARRARPTVPGLEPHQKPLLGSADGRIPVAKAAAIRAQLRQIIDDVAAAGASSAEPAEDEETVLVHLLVGYFTPTPPTA